MTVDYNKCCKIIEKLEDLDATESMSMLLICLSYNYQNVREYILNYYDDLLRENIEYD